MRALKEKLSDRLAQWVEAETLDCGSYPRFLEKLDSAAGRRVNRQTVDNWRYKEVKGISDKSIAWIAKYMGKPESVVSQWLKEGIPLDGSAVFNPPFSIPAWVTAASPNELGEMLQFIGKRLSNLQPP